MEVFHGYGFDHDACLERLNLSLRSAGLGDYDEDNGMCSQHWVFFAGIPAMRQPRILEIGTYRGVFTRVLSALFPDSEIVTCDLPDDSPTFNASYDRSDPGERLTFLADRAANLERLSNVTFIQQNSFMLPGLELGAFDLVWVDGGHDYPDVAWDVCNAWHMLAADGFLLVDDLYLDPRALNRRLIPDLNDSAHLLRLLQSEHLCDVGYIHKRLGRSALADPMLRKSIGVVVKLGAGNEELLELSPFVRRNLS